MDLSFLSFDISLVKMGIGLAGLILINILLGSMSGLLEGNFDKTKFKKGILKGFIVTISFVGCVIIGQLNPDIIVIEMDGESLNVLTGVKTILTLAYIWYGKECLTKLASFVNAKF